MTVKSRFFAVHAVVLVCIVFSLYTCSKRETEVQPKVPEWAKHAVWYQIFPERFRNGDPSNDPTVSDIKGSWPHEEPQEWSVSSWTGDWYGLQPWEAVDDKGFYYRVQQRRYGGDLQGVLDKLDYLSDLGVTALYFNPLFESPSLHKYDATMYHHIDNNFGPDPEGDKRIWESENPAEPATWQWTSADRLFLDLVMEAHSRNMKVIIDGVFNHVGMTFWAFQDVHKIGEKSRYKAWFTITTYENSTTPEDEFDYVGWYGVRELPELREDGNGLVHGPREHVREIVRRWMDPNGDGDPTDGIDGWRLDVAEKVAIPFWREFRNWVRSINPDAYITGEVWWEDHKNDRMFDAAPWLRGDVFDAVMNYRWARETGHFFKDVENKISATEFDRRLRDLRSDYPSDVNYVLMNLLDSHDTDRLASQIVNIDVRYDHDGVVRDNPNYNVRKPNKDEIKAQKLIAQFQMTYLGAPMIYYGDDAGMWGGDDPDDRKPMLWADMKYDVEKSHPIPGKARPQDKNEFDADLHQFYKQLIAVRNGNEALRVGDFQTVLADDARDLYGFTRSTPQNHVLVILNNGQIDQVVAIDATPLQAKQYRDALSGETVSVQDDKIEILLLAKSGRLLVGMKE